MDPLSITTAVTGLIGVCLKTAVQLDGLRSKYQNAGVIIAALCSESTVISAGLTQMQTLLAQNFQVRNREDLLTTFDTALTGCLVVFTCLEQETKKLEVAGSKGQSKLTWKMKARLIWNDDKMKDYLSLIRGQQASLSFLIQLLQMQSIDEVYQQVERQRDILRKQATRTESLRKANPSTNIPTSLLSAWRSPETLFGVAASTVATKEFEFDDDIVNSKAYRRAMAMARLAISQNSTVTEFPEGEEGDLIDLSESVPYPASAPILPAFEELLSLSLNPAPKSPEPFAPPDVLSAPEIYSVTPASQPSASAPGASLASAALPDWKPSPDVKPVEIHPREVAFERPLTRSQATHLVLRNPNSGRVIFKVMTTGPRKFCVRPNYGSLYPGQSIDVEIEMVALNEEPPADMVSKDKFLIQSMAAADDQNFVSYRMVSNAIRNIRTPDSIQYMNDSRDPKTFAQEKKLRVVFVPAKIPRPRSV